MTLGKQVYEQTREQIVNQTLRPGDRLSLRKIAASMNVSTGPVLEAINRLKYEGLVESDSGWGARVASLGPEQWRQKHVLRTALECEAARHCALRITDEQLQTLDEIARELDSRIIEGRFDATSVQLDVEFHESICQIACLDEIASLLQANRLCLMLTESSRVAANTDVDKRSATHRRIVKALRSADPDQAESCMRQHCEQAMKARLKAWIGLNS